MTAIDDISSGLQKQAASKYVKAGGKVKPYASDNPVESPRVLSYLSGGPEPSPWPTTLMGQGFAEIERGLRSLASGPPPSGTSTLIEGVGYVSASVLDFGA